ncbi:MAG: hypothetical protein IJU67_06305 [Lachnospiraceae bacterium]|nr:hypothetical protein [Lachnospiraceae bacterium]
MKKKAIVFYIILAAALAAVTLAVCVTFGRTNTMQVHIGPDISDDEVNIILEDDTGSLELTDRRLEDGVLSLTVRGVRQGRAFASVQVSGDSRHYDVLYVHPFGIVTRGYYFGRFNGDPVVPACAAVFLAALLAGMIVKYRRDMFRNMYQ